MSPGDHAQIPYASFSLQVAGSASPNLITSPRLTDPQHARAVVPALH